MSHLKPIQLQLTPQEVAELRAEMKTAGKWLRQRFAAAHQPIQQPCEQQTTNQSNADISPDLTPRQTTK